MLHLTTALDPASQVPLYQQLYRSLVAEIRSGGLPAGARMPGKRRLAGELSVSVNTVDGAYQMLAAEGYLASRPRSGFYVQEYPALPGREPGPEASGGLPAEADTGIPAQPPVRYDLSTSGVDTGLFPFRTWARLQKELLYTSPGLLARGEPRGRPGTAAGPDLLSGGIPRGALYAGSNCGGGGNRVSAQPVGASAEGAGRRRKSGLSPGPAGAGKQRPHLPLSAGG